jgi:hypothetical protein
LTPPTEAALLVPSARTALAFEHPDCVARPGLKHLVNQARLGVAFSAPSILAGFFTEKLAAVEKVHSSPLPKANL